LIEQQYKRAVCSIRPVQNRERGDGDGGANGSSYAHGAHSNYDGVLSPC